MAKKSGVPVAKRLKQARKEANLSQKELGIRAGIDEFAASARMNQYETATHVPSFQTLKNIAKVLDVDAAYFYCESDDLASLVKEFSRRRNAR